MAEQVRAMRMYAPSVLTQDSGKVLSFNEYRAVSCVCLAVRVCTAAVPRTALAQPLHIQALEATFESWENCAPQYAARTTHQFSLSCCTEPAAAAL